MGKRSGKSQPAKRRKRWFRPAPGASPGTLEAQPDSPKPIIRVIAYDGDHLDEVTCAQASEVKPLLAKYPRVWVDVDGFGDVDIIDQVGALFGLHPLALEDVVTDTMRSKVEEYGDHMFMVLRMVSLKNELETEQLGLFLGTNFVVTFQNHPGDCLDPVRDRLRRGKGRIRSAGSDYLMYAILDAVIDHYFPVLEQVGDELDSLEDAVVTSPQAVSAEQLYGSKRMLRSIRRAAWPMRDTTSILLRGNVASLVQEDTKIYLRDCYDHTIEVIDLLESYHDIASGLIDLHLSSLSRRMNEVMKVLTVISTIFMPLTFIVGVYGMNFNTSTSPWNMPELSWYWGYPVIMTSMATIAGVMLYAFRKRGWL